LSGILSDGLDGPGLVGEGPEGSDWFCAFTVGASASQEIVKTRMENPADGCISNLPHNPGSAVIAIEFAMQLLVPLSGYGLKPF
jgi:hypothetical protein